MAERRTGGRGKARNVFAVLWIALAGLSGFYLFTLFTDPTALGGPVQVSAATEDPTPAAPASVAPAAPAPAPAASLDNAEVSSLKDTIQNLSQQLAQLDSRLKPIERFIGPVAALPPSSTVSTSPPKPQEPTPEPAAAPELEPEAEVVEEAIEETVVETPPPPPPAPPPVAAAPEPEPKPELAPAVPAAPEPEPEQEAPAPVAATDEPEAAVAEEEVEIAAFDPVALPPASNDGSTRYGIEIGTVGKRDELRPLWREYLTKHAALVAGLQPRRVLAPDKKWRLIVGPFANAQDAEGACLLFKKADRPCAATVYAGDAL